MHFERYIQLPTSRKSAENVSKAFLFENFFDLHIRFRPSLDILCFRCVADLGRLTCFNGAEKSTFKPNDMKKLFTLATPMVYSLEGTQTNRVKQTTSKQLYLTLSH